MADKHVDDVSGVETTGHVWDGIRELDTLMPRWWLLTFYATIVWAVSYSSRADLTHDVEKAKAGQTVYLDKIATLPLAEIDADPQLRQFAISGGASAFKVNCAPCHGSGAAGGPGFPNLNDDDWLWGGNLDAIHQTIDNCASCHGEDAKGNRDMGAPDLADAIWLKGSGEDAIVRQVSSPRHGVMPAWGARLGDTTVKQLTIFVHSLGGGE